MTARQVFFGALGFRAPGDLEHAVRDTLAGAGPHVERLVHDARRGDRTLVFDVEGHLPSSLFSAITGCLSELAACAARGRVSMVYVGDGVEIAHACAPPEPGRDASGAVTQRWLSLVGERASIVLPGGEPCDFDVVARPDGTRALDLGDWLGLEGCLVERDDVLLLEIDRRHRRDAFEWACPAIEGSVRLVALEQSEAMVWTEVIGATTLESSSVRHEDLVEVVLHPMVVGSDAARFLQPGWRERSMSTRRLWLRPGVGVVAIG